MQNHNCSCGFGRCHAHACEALVTSSVSARYTRRLIQLNRSPELDMNALEHVCLSSTNGDVTKMFLDLIGDFCYYCWIFVGDFVTTHIPHDSALFPFITLFTTQLSQTLIENPMLCDVLSTIRNIERLTRCICRCHRALLHATISNYFQVKCMLDSLDLL